MYYPQGNQGSLVPRGVCNGADFGGVCACVCVNERERVCVRENGRIPRPISLYSAVRYEEQRLNNKSFLCLARAQLNSDDERDDMDAETAKANREGRSPTMLQ